MTLPRLLADVSQDAAVNVENQAVDEVGSLGGEEDSGAAQILGLAPALSGGLGNDELVERMTRAIWLQPWGLRPVTRDTPYCSLPCPDCLRR